MGTARTPTHPRRPGTPRSLLRSPVPATAPQRSGAPGPAGAGGARRGSRGARPASRRRGSGTYRYSYSFILSTHPRMYRMYRRRHVTRPGPAERRGAARRGAWGLAAFPGPAAARPAAGYFFWGEGGGKDGGFRFGESPFPQPREATAGSGQEQVPAAGREAAAAPSTRPAGTPPSCEA